MYYLHMQISDVDGTDIKELEWLYGRMFEEKKRELESQKGKTDGG